MIDNKSVAAVIVAAGASRRMGFDKLQAQIGGITVLAKSILAFDTLDAVDEIVVVTPLTQEHVRAMVPRLTKPLRVVAGGAERTQSVAQGVAQTDAELVAIHDAARPFVTADVILAALEGAAKYGVAAPAVPVKDTIKQAQGGCVTATPARDTLFAVQTPQCFVRTLYCDALAMLGEIALTDDCAVMEHAGHCVHLTQGDYANIKITTREDLPAQQGDSMLRIGHGYDVHKLVEGRKLILGGVEIAYEKGLLGHSDADVLAHAVADALLGACALGDIGKWFPDTDASYQGADSIVLLRRVAELVAQHGYAPSNVDATILCQRPKLAPHIAAMRQILAGAMGMDASDVSVKATTEEGLGFTGAGEGIAVHCVCILHKIV